MWGNTDNWKKREPEPRKPLREYLDDLMLYAKKSGDTVVSVPVDRVAEILAALPESKPARQLVDAAPFRGLWSRP